MTADDNALRPAIRPFRGRVPLHLYPGCLTQPFPTGESLGDPRSAMRAAPLPETGRAPTRQPCLPKEKSHVRHQHR